MSTKEKKHFLDGKTVWFADDNNLVRSSIGSFLEGYGAKVIHFSNPVGMLAELERLKSGASATYPDIIFTDWVFSATKFNEGTSQPLTDEPDPPPRIAGFRDQQEDFDADNIGPEILKAVQEVYIAQKRAIPVLLTTGGNALPYGLRSNVRAMPKPYTPGILLENMKALLEMRLMGVRYG